MKIISIYLIFLAALGSACKQKPGAGTARCGKDLLQQLAVAVSPEENREFSFTDKRSGYFYGATHGLDPENWFGGWNIATKRILKDYSLWINHQKLDRSKARVLVFPHQVSRTFDRVAEDFFLFDRLSALGIRLTDIQGDTIGLSLEGGLCKQAAQDQVGIWFRPAEDSAHWVLLCPMNNTDILIRDSILLAPATAEGFYLIHGTDKADIQDKLKQLRAEGAAMQEARQCRMEAIAQQAWAESQDSTLGPALAWLSLTLDQLITEQLGWGIYAGLPWFNDYWGRDMFITLPGACLVSGQFDVARKILLSFAQFQNMDPTSAYFGRIPNRARPNDIIYNTTDGTPRFVIQILEYVQYSGDTTIIRELFPVVTRTVEGSLQHWTDEHGYLTHEDADTWMDAKKKGVEPYSPRGNRANDIQALWVGQLRAAAFFAGFLGETEKQSNWTKIANQVEEKFASDFVLKDRDYLADRLDARGNADARLRPNQLFALDLIHDTLLRWRITRTAWEQLTYPWGVASLSQSDPDFHPYHEHWHYYHKDQAYHNGTVWLWNNGIAMQRMIEADQPDIAWELFRRMNMQALKEGAVGSLSENADALPKEGQTRGKLSGTFLQAWSNAEHLRVWHQHFLGFQPDMIQGKVRFRPRIPGDIRKLAQHARFGQTTLRVEYAAEGAKRSYVLHLLEGPGLRIEIDLPGYAPFTVQMEAGQVVRLSEEGARAKVLRQSGQGKTLEQQAFSADALRLQWLARANTFFEGTSFCRPYLSPGLKSLAVYHDPPLTY